MLTPEERQEIEAEFPHYPTRQAVCIDAMKIVQKHRSWVSDEALRDIGELLEMSTADLDGVATFYNLIFRKPVGRHVVFFCDSVSCWIMGGTVFAIACGPGWARVREKPAPTGAFTLLPSVCLGACDHAPVLMIDDHLHLDVETTKVDEILSRYR